MRLEPEQLQLLIDLVEAERSVPRELREKFIVSRTMGPPGVQLIHPGWKNEERRVFEGDLETLANLGFLYSGYGWRDTPVYHVSPEGFEFYREVMSSHQAPIQRAQEKVRSYVDSAHFRSRYPAAFKKWLEADSLLWVDDSAGNQTTIGHLCREAMQEFGTQLVALSKTPSVDPDPAKTAARIRAVITAKRHSLGDKRAQFLEALLAYWGAVADLTQRQEHGGQKEGQQLVFQDGFRLVFQTMNVMYELDCALA